MTGLNRVLMAIGLIILAGCSNPTIDTSSFEAYQNSLDELASGTDYDFWHTYHEAVMILLVNREG